MKDLRSHLVTFSKEILNGKFYFLCAVIATLLTQIGKTNLLQYCFVIYFVI